MKKSLYDDAINQLQIAANEDYVKYQHLVARLDGIVFIKEETYRAVSWAQYSDIENELNEHIDLDNIEAMGLQWGNGITEILRYMWGTDRKTVKKAITQTKVKRDMLSGVAKTINELLQIHDLNNHQKETLNNFKDYLLEELKKQFGKSTGITVTDEKSNSGKL